MINRITPEIESAAKAVARVMNGSISPNVGTEDDIATTVEDYYIAVAVIHSLLPPSDAMVGAGWEAHSNDPPPNIPDRIFTAMIKAAIGETKGS